MKKIKVYNTSIDRGGTVGYVDISKDDFSEDEFLSEHQLTPRTSFYSKVKEQLGVDWNVYLAWKFISMEECHHEAKQLIRTINVKKKLLKQLLCASQTT